MVYKCFHVEHGSHWWLGVETVEAICSSAQFPQGILQDLARSFPFQETTRDPKEQPCYSVIIILKVCSAWKPGS